MASVLLGTEPHGDNDALVGPSRRPAQSTMRQLLGAVMLTGSAYLLLAMVAGLSAARRLITDYEVLHGPLQIDNGYWEHGTTPGSYALCDQIDVVAGWLYPFGVLAWFPVLALVWIGSTLAFNKVKTIAAIVPLLTFLIVAVALYFVGTTGDVLAILE